MPPTVALIALIIMIVSIVLAIIDGSFRSPMYLLVLAGVFLYVVSATGWIKG